MIPDSLGAALDNVDWIPIDELAIVILELTRSASLQQTNNNTPNKATRGATVFNVVNPRATKWQKLLPSIMTASASASMLERRKGSKLRRVSFTEWAKAVRDRFELEAEAKVEGKSARDLKSILTQYPAMKLLGFYEEAYGQKARTWDITRAEQASATLRSVSAITDGMLANWMQDWLLVD